MIALALGTPASARRPLNWRFHKKPTVALSTSSAAALEAAAPAPAEPPSDGLAEKTKLMAGRWTPEARAAVEALIAERGRSSPGYSAKVPPVAVLSWSDAAVSGDPAELVFLRLVSEAKFRVDEAWWRLVPIGYGRQPTRAAYEQFVSLSTSVWTAQPSYHAWRKGMLSSYVSLCRGVGRKECRSYLAKLWAGWHEDEAEDYSKRVLDGEKSHAAASESVPGEPGDRSPLRARRGLRVIPEMRDLAVKLRAAGFDLWVVDDVPQPVLSAAAADYGVDRSRIYGVHNSTAGARMGSDVTQPVPTRGGKTEAVQASLGRAPDLVVGRDGADFDLLSYGEGVRVVFDSDPELVRKARERGWLVQPSFAR